MKCLRRRAALSPLHLPGKGEGELEFKYHGNAGRYTGKRNSSAEDKYTYQTLHWKLCNLLFWFWSWRIFDEVKCGYTKDNQNILSIQ